MHLVASNLERDELLALYGCCDVFLSRIAKTPARSI